MSGRVRAHHGSRLQTIGKGHPTRMPFLFLYPRLLCAELVAACWPSFVSSLRKRASCSSNLCFNASFSCLRESLSAFSSLRPWSINSGSLLYRTALKPCSSSVTSSGRTCDVLGHQAERLRHFYWRASESLAWSYLLRTRALRNGLRTLCS